MAAMRETKSAVLFIEHDMEIVSRYAERVWAFVGGRIVGDGPAAEVLASPKFGGKLSARTDDAFADNLFASAGKTPILRGAALEVAAGETARLTGRNGAGKTTFMRAVMGLIKIDGGKIMFDGADLTRAPASRRARLGIGYMPEDRKLVPDFTVEENILLPMWATVAGRRRRGCGGFAN